MKYQFWTAHICKTKHLPLWMRSTAIFLLLCLATSAKAQMTSLTFQSTEERTALTELYSSEGCNSCPPAETWLNHLKNSPALWKRFVPVDFHVDYWDYIGWRDPWGSPKFSERQRAYASQWGSDNIYTPEFVLNGREWLNWSERDAILKLPGEKTGVLIATSTNANHWVVKYTPASGESGNFEIHAALLGNNLASDVKAGENRGRHLQHEFTALNLVSAPLVNEAGKLKGAFDLPVKGDTSNHNFALAVWVTKAGQLEPLQATGGWL
jgi:hypothetical protein